MLRLFLKRLPSHGSEKTCRYRKITSTTKLGNYIAQGFIKGCDPSGLMVRKAITKEIACDLDLKDLVAFGWV